jgi:hypothetical protein
VIFSILCFCGMTPLDLELTLQAYKIFCVTVFSWVNFRKLQLVCQSYHKTIDLVLHFIPSNPLKFLWNGFLHTKHSILLTHRNTGKILVVHYIVVK